MPEDYPQERGGPIRRTATPEELEARERDNREREERNRREYEVGHADYARRYEEASKPKRKAQSALTNGTMPLESVNTNPYNPKFDPTSEPAFSFGPETEIPRNHWIFRYDWVVTPGGQCRFMSNGFWDRGPLNWYQSHRDQVRVVFDPLTHILMMEPLDPKKTGVRNTWFVHYNACNRSMHPGAGGGWRSEYR